MPINLQTPNGITKSHTAERLEINLLSTNEDVEQMEIKVYFNVDTLLNGEKIAETHWDNKPLILNCKNNERLREAMLVIQEEIGIGRYQQLTTPPENPVP